MRFMAVLSFILCFSSLRAETLRLPDEFYMSQHWLSWTLTFDIETDQYKIGTINRRFFSLSTQYEYFDFQGNLEATAKSRFFSFGWVFDLVDAQMCPIGQLKQKIFHFFPTFEILSPNGEILAIAKMNFWGTSYSLTDPVTSIEIAKISRSFFRWKDDWTIKLVDRDLFEYKGIDPRLLITLAACQSDKEMWERNKAIMQQAVEPEAP